VLRRVGTVDNDEFLYAGVVLVEAKVRPEAWKGDRFRTCEVQNCDAEGVAGPARELYTYAPRGMGRGKGGYQYAAYDHHDRMGYRFRLDRAEVAEVDPAGTDRTYVTMVVTAEDARVFRWPTALGVETVVLILVAAALVYAAFAAVTLTGHATYLHPDG
jgi:hypothetical protein